MWIDEGAKNKAAKSVNILYIDSTIELWLIEWTTLYKQPVVTS